MAPNKRGRSTRSSRNRDPTPTPSPSPPPSPQQPPQPTYQKFQSPEALARFEVINRRKFVGERRFDVMNLSKFPNFESTLRFYGWEKFNNEIIKEESNTTISLEFFANAFKQKGEFISFVRGKQIRYTPRDINRLLGLTPPANCAVREKRNRSTRVTDEDWEKMRQVSGKEDAEYVRSAANRNPTRLNVVDLKPIAKAWASFIHANIESVSSTSELPVTRLFILDVIMQRKSIDLGSLIANSIKSMADGGGKALGHSCIINALCKKEHVEAEVFDIMWPSQRDIDNSAMTKFVKEPSAKFKEPGEPSQPAEGGPSQRVDGGPSHPAPEVPYYPPLHPMQEAYYFGSANWMQDVSAQMHFHPPYFTPEFTAAADQYRQRPHGSFQRFQGSEENMSTFFQNQRERAAQREAEIRADFARGAEATDAFVQDLPSNTDDLFQI